MVTRHTITHADELYAGNAFLQGTDHDGNTVGSPDGRRGIQIPHIYVREYGAIVAEDTDGLFDSQLATKNGELVSLCTGAWASITAGTVPTGTLTNVAGSGTLVLDTPRNICWGGAKNMANLTLKIVGKDEYGQVMAEAISGCSNTTVHGVKAFKSINSMLVTGNTASYVSIGFSNKIGLPHHLGTKGRFLGLNIDGERAGITSASAAYALVCGLNLATDATSTYGDPDVRGSVNVTQSNYVPDGSKIWTAMMVVDHTTRDKAYGNAQCTAVTI